MSNSVGKIVKSMCPAPRVALISALRRREGSLWTEVFPCLQRIDNLNISTQTARQRVYIRPLWHPNHYQKSDEATPLGANDYCGLAPGSGRVFSGSGISLKNGAGFRFDCSQYEKKVGCGIRIKKEWECGIRTTPPSRSCGTLIIYIHFLATFLH